MIILKSRDNTCGGISSNIMKGVCKMETIKAAIIASLDLLGADELKLVYLLIRKLIRK